MGKRQRAKPQVKEIVDEDLDRFAGSSDEEEEEETPANIPVEHDADNEESDSGEEEAEDASQSEEEKDEDDSPDEEDDDDEEEEEELQPAEKMANAMARILGTGKASSSSVVLAKTVTPLQRMQKEAKDKEKEQSLKRRATKERNLAALHIPLSVATSNAFGQARPSISKELERERLHRRVATRGVVALFNAITQHQHAETGGETQKKTETPKMTKHGFLDKIKKAALPDKEEEKQAPSRKNKSTAAWAKDDFMLKPSKNWDEESSEDDSVVRDIDQEEDANPVERKPKRSKKNPVQ
eukprot:Nitzschia sp. Nitz4//scaffold22_size323478//283235//284277//NITZ4_000582-RA/size323478-augustus-gene-0.250-mRNA-1//-1//CDS//3329543162//8393//frame0